MNETDSANGGGTKTRGPKVLIGILVPLGVVTALVLALAWFGQRAMIYFPDKTIPGSAALIFERGTDVTFETSDGLTLNAWRIDPSDSNGMAALYLPGNGGHRLGRAEVGQSLADEGFTVLLVDYRGYADNPGKPSEKGLLADAQAAADHLTAASFPANKTIYVGESIGTGVAVQLAATQNPVGVILRSPYTSLGDVAKDTMRLPVGWILRDKFDSRRHIKKVRSPVTVLLGQVDEIIPPEQSRKIARTAPNLFELVEIPGVGHNDEIWFGRFVAEKATELVDSSLVGDRGSDRAGSGTRMLPPVIAEVEDLDGATFEISQARPLVVNAPDPTRWMGETDDAAVAEFVPGEDDALAVFNPGFKATGKGSTSARVTGPDGTVHEFTIRVG